MKETEIISYFSGAINPKGDLLIPPYVEICVYGDKVIDACDDLCFYDGAIE